MGEYSASQISTPPRQYSAGDIAKPKETPGYFATVFHDLGGSALMDVLHGVSGDPEKRQKAIDTLKGIGNGLLNEGPRVMKELDDAGEAAKRGDWDQVMHHIAGAAPLVGPGIHAYGSALEKGNYREAAGHATAALLPAAAPRVPAAARAIADTDIGAATIGAAKGAGKALVETTRPTFRGIESPVPIPTAVVSGAAGGQAAAMMGLPRAAGTVAGVAAPVVRGAIKGAKGALAERAMVADAAKIPPDVMAELTRESGAPGAPPIADPPEVSPGQPIPEGGAPVDLIRQQNEEALARLQQDQASRAQTGPVPVRPTPLLGPGPANVFEAPPAPDGSFVRAVPAQYPQVEPQAAAPKTIAQQIQESVAEPQPMIGGHKPVKQPGSPLRPPVQAQPTAPAPTVPAVSPQGIPPSPSSEAAPGATRPMMEAPLEGESPVDWARKHLEDGRNPDAVSQYLQRRYRMAYAEAEKVIAQAGATRPVVESPQSGYTAGGERKSPELRGAEITAANTTSKAKRFAEAMAAKGVTADIAEQMQSGRVSDAQIGKGAAPRWGNLADFIGETEPKSSVPEIIAELRKMEGAKTSTPTSKESLQVQPARSVKDMTRAELAKQAGLPENATTDQIMKALADAMEEEKPKAAAAGKGKQ